MLLVVADESSDFEGVLPLDLGEVVAEVVQVGSIVPGSDQPDGLSAPVATESSKPHREACRGPSWVPEMLAEWLPQAPSRRRSECRCCPGHPRWLHLVRPRLRRFGCWNTRAELRSSACC